MQQCHCHADSSLLTSAKMRKQFKYIRYQGCIKHQATLIVSLAYLLEEAEEILLKTSVFL